MSGTPNTILVEPANGQQRVVERLAAAAIIPGSGIKLDSAGKWALAGAAEGDASKAFAVENIADALGIDDAYVSGDTMRGLYAQTGDMVNAILADSQVIVIGAALESAASGELQAQSAGALVGFAEEAITTSGANSRILVRVA